MEKRRAVGGVKLHRSNSQQSDVFNAKALSDSHFKQPRSYVTEVHADRP